MIKVIMLIQISMKYETKKTQKKKSEILYQGDITKPYNVVVTVSYMLHKFY